MDKPKPEADDADIAQAFLSTPDAARKLMPSQLAKDLRTVGNPLLATRGRMDGRYGVFAIIFMGAMALAAPAMVYFSETPIHRGDWIAMVCLEITMISALTTVVVQRRAQQRLRRFATGRCIHCGYNLVATPDRCPECGNKPYAG